MLIVIYTRLAHAAANQEGTGFGLVESWNHSGWLARGVIICLSLMLLATVVISIERLIAFNRARRQSVLLAAHIQEPLLQGQVEQAFQLAKDPAYQLAYLGSLLRAGLSELCPKPDPIRIEHAERAVQKAIQDEQSKLKRGMSVLATTGATAPFVGLFGTTFGVVNAFQGMATEGSGLAAISAGISEALITTGVGIFVAVVGVWAYNYFNQRIDKTTDELLSSKAELFAWAHKQCKPSPPPTTP